jgi:Rrf2 family iron-sulfur cluster assembly transcriptional regulator
MFRYGKLARQAVSAVSYVAERHCEDGPAVSSAEVGKARRIPKALAAKLLSEAAAAGLLRGTTGPGGGYRLARPPEEIFLMNVVSLFERPMDESPCPFGPGWCGKGEPCPLHDDFVKLEEKVREFLEGTSFAAFATHPEEARRGMLDGE